MLSKNDLIYLGAAIIFNSGTIPNVKSAVEFSKEIYQEVFHDEENDMICE